MSLDDAAAIGVLGDDVGLAFERFDGIGDRKAR